MQKAVGSLWTSSSGNSAFFAHRSSNIHGHFLNIVEYRRGGRRDLIIILEEVDGNGWRKMALELCALCFSEGKNIEKEKREVTSAKQYAKVPSKGGN